ncbi:MAG TPA: FG-GAP-like repeat-containing protein [Solirubrobacteraceae bacterium]|nr:FG-GAP-like repeat-containing protein [Solirubrobacteraceae bacterium]
MRRLLALTFALALALAAPAAADFVQDNGSPRQVGFAPYGVATADLDGNGTPDFAAASATSGTVAAFLRQTNGTWLQDPATPRTSFGADAIAIGDLDGNGRPDLAVARFPSSQADVYFRLANGLLSDPVTALAVPGATSVKIARVNADALPDLVFGSSDSDDVYVVLRNAANTGFDAPVALVSAGNKPDLELTDFTGDGRVDIAASNDAAASIDLWVQQVNGTFLQGSGFPASLGARALGLAQADFNGDGRPDLAVALPAIDKVAVLLGQAGGGFASMPGSPFDVGDSPVGVTTADFNRDGAADLATANQGGKSISVLLRTATGFANDPSSPIVTDQFATELATADFNADGKTDLAVANQSSNTVSILLNSTPDPVTPPPPPPPPPPDLDADDDGASVPLDCRDDDPNIRPGLRDVPQDGIDQDCSGSDADFPVLRRRVRYAYDVTAAGAIKFTRLSVTPGRTGDRVTLSCKGRGCTFKSRRVRVRKNRASLSLLPQVKQVRLRKGAILTVRVTRTATLGQYMRLKVVKQDLKPTARCLRPGVAKPIRCPES